MSTSDLLSSEEVDADRGVILGATKSSIFHNEKVKDGDASFGARRTHLYSCMRCRVRKLRCDGQRPMCYPCGLVNGKCEYPARSLSLKASRPTWTSTKSSSAPKIEHPSAPIKPPQYRRQMDGTSPLSDPFDGITSDSRTGSIDNLDVAHTDKENVQRLSRRPPPRGYASELAARLAAIERELLNPTRHYAYEHSHSPISSVQALPTDSIVAHPSSASWTSAMDTSHETSRIQSPSVEPDDDWSKISNATERRRIQNRIAQRNYRQRLKLRLEGLERNAATPSEEASSSDSEVEPEPELKMQGLDTTYRLKMNETLKTARKIERQYAERQSQQLLHKSSLPPYAAGNTLASEGEHPDEEPGFEAPMSESAVQDPPTTETNRSSSESEISFVRGHHRSDNMGFDDEHWNEQTQQFIEIFASRIVPRCMTATKALTERTDNTPQTGKSSSPSTVATVGTSNAGGLSSRKRSRRTQGKGKGKDDDAEEDEDAGGNSPDNKRQRGSDEPAKLFACPYAKHDPSRYSEQNQDEKNYRGCASKYLSSVSRVKQHLYRVHARPHWYCGNCYVEFATREQLNDHHRQRPPCDARSARFDEMMTDEQYTQIKRKGFGKTPRDAWYSIFRILFPDSEAPVSPYVSTSHPETLRHFVYFFRTYGPMELSNLMRESAERNGGPIALEASTQAVVDEAFEIALPEYLRQTQDAELDVHIEAAERESGSNASITDTGFDWNPWPTDADAQNMYPAASTASVLPSSLSLSPDEVISWDPLNPSNASAQAPVPATLSVPPNTEFDADYVYLDIDAEMPPQPGAYDVALQEWHQGGW